MYLCIDAFTAMHIYASVFLCPPGATAPGKLVFMPGVNAFRALQRIRLGVF